MNVLELIMNFQHLYIFDIFYIYNSLGIYFQVWFREYGDDYNNNNAIGEREKLMF